MVDQVHSNTVVVGVDGMAREHGADHLVVGRVGQSKVRSLLFGSTPGNLIQIALVPVTVVP